MWQRFSHWLLSKSFFFIIIIFGGYSSTAWDHGKDRMCLAGLVVSFCNGLGKCGANLHSLWVGPTAVGRQVFKDHMDRQCNIWGWRKWVVKLLFSLKETGGGRRSGCMCCLVQLVAMLPVPVHTPGGCPRLKSERGVESHDVLEIRIFQQHAPVPKSRKAPRDYHIID